MGIMSVFLINLCNELIVAKDVVGALYAVLIVDAANQFMDP